MAENIGRIKDATISIKPTPKLLNFLQQHMNEFSNFKEEVTENIKLLEKDKNILLKVTDIEWLDSFLRHKRNSSESACDLFEGENLDKEIHRLIQNEDLISNERCDIEKNENVFLYELIEGCELVLPQNEVIERNPVLAARIERLKKEQAEKEYKAMTRNVNTAKKFVLQDTISYQLNMMNRHLIAVGQFLISVAAGFAFGFLGVQLIVGDLEFGFRLLLGIMCALIIALAEFYFLAKHLIEDEDDEEPMPFRSTEYSSSNGKTHTD